MMQSYVACSNHEHIMPESVVCELSRLDSSLVMKSVRGGITAEDMPPEGWQCTLHRHAADDCKIQTAR